MPLDPTSPAAIDFIRTAAFLKIEFEGHSETVNFLEADTANRIIYVFDTDVIITKCAPWITGPAKDHENGYGAIFDPRNEVGVLSQEHSQKRAESIANILASYLFGHQKTSTERAPIFQFPLHARETNNVYRAVRRAVEARETFKPQHARFRQNYDFARMAALVRHSYEYGGNDEDVRSIAEKIVDLLLHQGRAVTERAKITQEWDNYYSLEAEYGGIYPVSDAPTLLRNPPGLAQAFAVMQAKTRTPEEDNLYKALIEHWQGLLSVRDRQNVEADAEALALVFLVNRRLQALNWRCVFVTGDRTLVRSTYKRLSRLNFSDEIAKEHSQFSKNFVRHIWAFASDALIEPDKKQRFLDLFNGLLAQWSERIDLSVESLEQLVNSPSKIRAQISDLSIRRALAEWDQLTGKAITRYSISSYESNQQLVSAILQLLRQHASDLSWSALQTLLREELNRIRDRTTLSLSDLGIDVVLVADTTGRRNPPELIFDSLTHTDQIFRTLMKAGGYPDAKHFLEDVAKIKNDCHDASIDGDDRQESHLKFLVLGAAFASAERWLIAFSHARRAIDIIERSKTTGSPIAVRRRANGDPQTHMSGREAYFLAGVCQRVIAADADDLDQASIFLDSAFSALADDKAKGTAANIGFARFTNERLALALAKYYSARSDAPDDDCNTQAIALMATSEAVVDFFQEAFKQEPPSGTRPVTLVNMATNIIQCFVVQRYRVRQNLGSGRLEIGLELVKSCVTTIDRYTASLGGGNRSNEIYATMLIKAYALVGHMFTADTDVIRQQAKSDFFVLLKIPEDAIVTRYDKWRYDALSNFVENSFE